LLQRSSSFRFLLLSDGTNRRVARFSSPLILSAIERVDFTFVIAAPVCLSVAVRTIKPRLAQLSRRKAERPADEYFGEIHEIRR
jgi:hypothetical protein